MVQISGSKLQKILKQIQLRAQVACEHHLTHEDLAKLAGVSPRSLGDWMRGVTAPIGMVAVFELLSLLPEEDVRAILRYWKSCPAEQSSEVEVRTL